MDAHIGHVRGDVGSHAISGTKVGEDPYKDLVARMCTEIVCLGVSIGICLK